jgi:hypothetical protein
MKEKKMANEATSSPTVTPFTKNEIRDMLRQLKMKFDGEMRRTNLKTDTVVDLCNAMRTTAYMLNSESGIDKE